MSKAPRISVNKLAEYMTARSARQRQILRDQKYPSDFKRTYYKEASEAISRCIASNLENTTVLENAISVLNQSTATKIGTRRRLDANIDALETFQVMLDDINLGNCLPRLGDSAPRRLVIQGVEVSVRPEIILTGEGKKSARLVGGIKLHFPRTFSLNDDAAGYVSVLVQEWCRNELDADGTPYGPYCYVIDVGAKRVCPPVRAIAARIRDIEAACRNIAALWPSIREEGDG